MACTTFMLHVSINLSTGMQEDAKMSCQLVKTSILDKTRFLSRKRTKETQNYKHTLMHTQIGHMLPLF